MDIRLAEDPDRADEVPLSSPWDAWWPCYRMALQLDQIGVGVAVPHGACPTCERDALKLAAANPPGHPGLGQPRSCRCLLKWAVRMRSPTGQVSWPPVSLSLALLKPGAPWDWVGPQLAPAHEVLLSFQRTLTTMDTRRLYPEAYGTSYLAARDACLTRAPALVLVLRALAPGSGTSGQVKARIRPELGGDVLHNHLHMPDNPARPWQTSPNLTGNGRWPSCTGGTSVTEQPGAWRSTGLHWESGRPVLTAIAPPGEDCPQRRDDHRRGIAPGSGVGWSLHGPRRCTGVWADTTRALCPAQATVPEDSTDAQCPACAAGDRGRQIARDAALGR